MNQAQGTLFLLAFSLLTGFGAYFIKLTHDINPAQILFFRLDATTQTFTRNLIPLTYLGWAAGGLAFLLFMKGVKLVKGQTTQIIIMTEVLVASLVGTLLLGEPITSQVILGGSLILSGVVITGKKKISCTFSNFIPVDGSVIGIGYNLLNQLLLQFMSKAIIIPITTDTLDGFKEVILSAFESTPDSDLAEWYSFDHVKQTLQNKQGCAFKAIINNRIVGAIHIQPESPAFGKEGTDKWQVTNIGVVPQYQRQGIGGKLLDAAENEASKKKYSKIIIHTNPGDRRAVSFYLKYGYTPIGILEDYYYRGPAQFF